MRRAAKIDSNQPEIISALRRCGCFVQPLHQVGGGVPDLLVGRAGVNYLLEVKDGSLPPSARELTDAQKDWHAVYRGTVTVVNNVAEALQAVGL